MSIELIKKLRDITGAGMMDCKKALSESNNNFEDAVTFLRKRGQQIAGKRADKETKEGQIASFVSEDGKIGSIVEINCETDFVSENEEFVKFSNIIAETICKNTVSSVEELMEAEFSGNKIKSLYDDLVLKFKEKVEIKRFDRKESKNGVIGSYVHFDGSAGSICEIENISDVAKMKNIANDVAMHTVAMKPSYLKVEDIPNSIIEKEKEVLSSQPDMASKPKEIVEKIIIGRINKFYSENCLVKQLFVKDDSKTIENLISNSEKDASLSYFKFYELGV
ncbi:translation elongation factor Ts [Patescibacteria group bacterium]|nr:translation elongation factor Ts [Patescibacteria group bacterium]